MRRLLWPCLAIAACQGAVDDPPPVDVPTGDTETDTTDTDTAPATIVREPICDAGHEVWVTRAMGTLWGRRPHGSEEVRAWSAFVEAHGRDAAVAAMQQDEAWLGWMQDWLMDAMAIDRAGDRVFPTCYHERELGDTPDLAAFIRDNDPLTTDFGQPFRMADVFRSSLLLDDVSVVYRAHLLVRMQRHTLNANVGLVDSEHAFRENYGDSFADVYLNRRMDCLACHNSQASVTGHPDPKLDRTWEQPGHLEKALFGTSNGGDPRRLYAMFPYFQLVESDAQQVAPWGIASPCGTLAPPGFTDEILDESAYFITDYGKQGQPWALERALATGVDALRGKTLTVDDDEQVDGHEAFAFMLATSLADRAWTLGTGFPLTLPHRFPRNQAQRDTLQHLTQVVLDEGFSLRALMREVVLDPYYNPKAPADCDDAGLMHAMFEPFSVDETIEANHPNTPGDMLRRRNPRATLIALHDVMGWEPPPSFYGWTSPTSPPAAFHQTFGVYQSDLSVSKDTSIPFESMLAFQEEYGRCQPRADLYQSQDAECGVAHVGGDGGNGAACQSCVCTLLPECCGGPWTEACATACVDDCGGCGAEVVDLNTVDDVIARLAAKTVDEGATLGDAIGALRDRLLLDGQANADEAILLAELAGAPLASVPDDVAALDAMLRPVCGAMVSSPQYLLSLPPAGIGAKPSLTVDPSPPCAQVAVLAAATGKTWPCPTDP